MKPLLLGTPVLIDTHDGQAQGQVSDYQESPIGPLYQVTTNEGLIFYTRLVEPGEDKL
jgi:hypothetical protein